MSELTGRRILVTGAGKGIGRATVCLLAGKGARVIAVARTRADLESLAAETGCETVEADLADADAVDGLIARAGRVEDVVNCAGTTTLEPASEFSRQTFEEIMAVNVRAPMALSRDFARQAIERGGGGSIVNISSSSTHGGQPLMAAYVAAKSGVVGLTKSLAAYTRAKVLTEVGKDVPMGRAGQPAELAPVYVMLASEEASYVSGATVAVTGGKPIL